MGLDISAYRQIAKIDAVFDAGGEPIDPVTREPVEYDMQAYRNDEFPGRADDIEDRAIYKAADSMGFRAGSYGGYNAWRNDFAEFQSKADECDDHFTLKYAEWRKAFEMAADGGAVSFH
jgi:hypothetical protein